MKLNLNPFNKDFGNRLYGISFTLWWIVCGNFECTLWMRILTLSLFVYFITFGTSRFDKEYRKII